MLNPLRHVDLIYRRLIALVYPEGINCGQQEKAFYRAAVIITDNFCKPVWPITNSELQALRPMADIALMRAYTHGTYRLAYQIEKPRFTDARLLSAEFYKALDKHRVSDPKLGYVRQDSIIMVVADGLANEINSWKLYRKLSGSEIIKMIRVFNGSAKLGIVARHGYPQSSTADPLSVLSLDSTHKNAKCCMLNVA